MSYLSTVGRAILATPGALLRSPQTKLSLAMGAYLGLTVGASTRAAGSTPAAVIAQVRDEIIAADGTLAQSAAERPPSPVEQAAADVLGPWVLEPVVTAPESWNRVAEQVLVVPMLQALFGVIEFTGGLGYTLAAVVPPQVIAVGGLLFVTVATGWYLLSLREVFN